MRSAPLLSLLALACLWMLPAAVPAAAETTAEWFGMVDLDHDSKIDRSEYQRRMVEVFYFADKDKNGLVTIEELTVIEKVDEAAFRKADKSGDGKLDLQEFVAYRMIQFDEADANRDGVLTYEEVVQWEQRR